MIAIFIIITNVLFTIEAIPQLWRIFKRKSSDDISNISMALVFFVELCLIRIAIYSNMQFIVWFVHIWYACYIGTILITQFIYHKNFESLIYLIGTILLVAILTLLGKFGITVMSIAAAIGYTVSRVPAFIRIFRRQSSDDYSVIAYTIAFVASIIYFIVLVMTDAPLSFLIAYLIGGLTLGVHIGIILKFRTRQRRKPKWIKDLK